MSAEREMNSYTIKVTAVASMRPRFVERGKRRRDPSTRTPMNASMRPRFVERGKQRPRID